MKHTLWFIGVLLIAVTLCGCGAAVLPDSEAPPVQSGAQSTAPQEQPTAETPPEGEAQTVYGWPAWQQAEQEPLLALPAQGEYTAAEAAALTGDAPWAGPLGWPVEEQQPTLLPRVTDGELVDSAKWELPVLDCPLNGRLLTVCPAPGGLALVTDDGGVWFADAAGADPVQVGSLPLAAGAQPAGEVIAYTDGEVLWCGYGRQILRLYLPTGRVDGMELQGPCAAWLPLSRSRLYCQYRLSDGAYSAPWSRDQDAPTVLVQPFVLDLQQQSETLLSGAAHRQLTAEGDLPTEEQAARRWQDISLGYQEYFAKERPVRDALDYSPAAEGDTCTYWLGTDYGYRQLPGLYEKFALPASLAPVPQLWCAAHTQYRLESSLNDRVWRSHALAGRIWVLTEDLQLYSTDADGGNAQQLLQLPASGMENYLPGPVLLRDTETRLVQQWSYQFSGPLLWVLAGGQLHRIYLPTGQCDSFALAAPEGLAPDTLRRWAPLSNRAVEFFCTDGESHCWTVQQLEAGTAQCVSSHTAPLQELQFWQEDFVSYLPLYQPEG